MVHMILTMEKSKFIFGIVLGMVLPLFIAEAYLRLFPVKDIQVYLGEDSPLTGFYKPHDEFGVTYESWEAMSRDNMLTENMFETHINGSDSRPLWIICGSSFADMLKSDMQEVIQDKWIAKFHRHKVILPLQIAQLQMLLDKGIHPQKIYFVLLTLEGGVLAEHPLTTRYISSKGALLYHPRKGPMKINWLIENSRVGLTAWVRSGQAIGTPGFKRRHLHDSVPKQVVDDFRSLFSAFAEIAEEKGVEISIILVPRTRQILKGADFAFQDTLGGLFQELGFTVIDPREEFLTANNRYELFIPDGHLSKAGNNIIIQLILQSESFKFERGDS